MDAVAGLLDGPRARGAFLLRSTMDPPWSLRIEDEAPLTLVAIVRGQRLHRARRRRAVWLRAGDVAIARGPDPYLVADDPATPPQAVIHPGGECRTPDGQELKLMDFLGTRNWGNSPDGETVMLTGTYQLEGEVSGRLLRALPPLLVLAGRRLGHAADRPARRRDRQGRARPGGRAGPAARPAADRRRCAPGSRARRPRRRAGTAPTPTRSSGPRCGRCTTTRRTRGPSQELARGAGVSRAALARRFNDLVGEPPMSLPDRLADRARRRPAARARRHRRLGRRPGRLRQPVRALHRVQAPARHEPAAVPRRRCCA